MDRLVLAWLLAATVASSAPASAAIYGWTDRDGATNYTNDLANVPEAYRDGVTTVVRETARAVEPSSEVVSEPAPREAPVVEAAAPATDGAGSSALVDAAYWAGFRAAADAPVIPFPVAAPVEQNVQIINSPPYRDVVALFGVPAFVRPRHAFPPRRSFVPAQGPFVQGPAGPPPLGAVGPPPVSFQPGLR